MFFFIPYVLAEIPANSLFVRSGIAPRIWLSTATLLFGIVMICHGYAPNWQTLAGLRWPLGFVGSFYFRTSYTEISFQFEGFLFPGSILLITSWYPRYETQKRVSAFYLMGGSQWTRLDLLLTQFNKAQASRDSAISSLTVSAHFLEPTESLDITGSFCS